MIRLGLGRGGITKPSSGWPALELILCHLEKRCRSPEQRLSLRRRSDGRAIVAGQHASLQLPNPVPALRQGQVRLTRQVAFAAGIIELRIVKAPERRGQPTQRPDQPELRGNDVDDEAEPRLLRKLESPIGL